MTTTPDNRVEVVHGDIVRHVRTGTTFRVITSPYQLGHRPERRMVVESVRGPRRRKSVNPDDFARIDTEMGPAGGASLHSEQPADQGEHAEMVAPHPPKVVKIGCGWVVQYDGRTHVMLDRDGADRLCGTLLKSHQRAWGSS